jgi:predicted XRE-type DNA-binding protein
MLVIRDRIQSTKLSQAAIAEQCNIYQPRVSALVNGHIDQFSIDDLVRIAVRLDVNVEIAVGNKE